MTTVVTIQGGKLVEVTSAVSLDQTVASDVWTLHHNLGKFPSVTIVDSAGSVIEGDVNYVSSDTIIVRFQYAFAGTAHLN